MWEREAESTFIQNCFILFSSLWCFLSTKAHINNNICFSAQLLWFPSQQLVPRLKQLCCCSASVTTSFFFCLSAHFHPFIADPVSYRWKQCGDLFLLVRSLLLTGRCVAFISIICDVFLMVFYLWEAKRMQTSGKVRNLSRFGKFPNLEQYWAETELLLRHLISDKSQTLFLFSMNGHKPEQQALMEV